MSLNLNQCVLGGNLTADPELHHTSNGTAVANFDLAVNSGYGDKKRVLYISAVVFGKTAEAVVKYTAKGCNVVCIGELVLDSWTGEDGKKQNKIKLNVSEIKFVTFADNKDKTTAQSVIDGDEF